MNQDQIKESYGAYWDHVKGSVDEDGWTYAKEVPYLLDYYFEKNTGKDTEYQKRYEGEWRGIRWRPKELTEIDGLQATEGKQEGGGQ